MRSAANNRSLIPTPQFIAASAPNLQDYFAVHGKNPPAYTSTLLKSDLISGFTPTPGGAFDQLPNSTPVFGMVAFQAPANAGGGNPQNT